MKDALLNRRVTVQHGAYLPHWRAVGATYHSVFRLVDALPAKIVENYRAERAALLAESEGHHSPAVEDRLRVLFSERIERFLDSGNGACWLAQPDVAKIVAGSLQYFESTRYRLFAWCVMPNHVHTVMRPLSPWDLSQIIHSWKSYTGTQANRLLNRTGAFWQKESFDHIVRDASDLERTIGYVQRNPIQAGLLNWQWVSL